MGCRDRSRASIFAKEKLFSSHRNGLADVCREYRLQRFEIKTLALTQFVIELYELKKGNIFKKAPWIIIRNLAVKHVDAMPHVITACFGLCATSKP
jgi:hypothetical protein